MSAAFLLLALASFLLGVSCFMSSDSERTIAVRILGILCAIAGAFAWFARL